LTLRIVLKVLWIFPVRKKRLLFVSLSGKQYSCNPKYIFEHLYRKYGTRLEYGWCLNDHIVCLPFDKIKCFKNRSIRYIFYAMTTRVYITNDVVNPYIPFRKSQVIINTWHGGGGYKASGSISVDKNTYSDIRFRLKTAAHDVTYFVSSSELFTARISENFFIDKRKFLPIGMPRNDLFFQNTVNTDEIKKKLNINNDCGIAIYIPTFRGSLQNPCAPKNFDIALLIETLGKKYNKQFVVLYRIHNKIEKHAAIENAVDVSSYPDVQELLCAADVLISDYSSVMWDFSLTYKPCFVYAPDLADYKNERDFSTPIETWPYPVAQTNEELRDNILHFCPAAYKAAVEKHHRDLGSYEQGTATEAICRIIERAVWEKDYE